MWKAVGRELVGTARDSWDKYVWEDMRGGEKLGVCVKQRGIFFDWEPDGSL